MPKDPQGRKWLLTINNPAEKGLDHKAIQKGLNQFPSLTYYCMGDEKGETYHTHIFFALERPTRFSTIKKRFPESHIDRAEGTAAECRAYVQKSGKWPIMTRPKPLSLAPSRSGESCPSSGKENGLIWPCSTR